MSEQPRDRAAEAAEFARLAALDPVEYDRQREAAAKALGIRVSVLDQQVARLRPKPETEARGIHFGEADPWPEPVVAAALLQELVGAIRRHVILAPATADCIALWIAHTYVYHRFQHTPRLSITSPAKRCGKSTLLDVLKATTYRPLKADNISASGVFRTVEALKPLTLLVDEADSFLGDNEELRGILNSGFEASGEVVRIMEVGDDYAPVRFSTFCPVALAGIGNLPGTLEDRAVPVVLQRKGAGEHAVKLRAPGARAVLQDLRSKLTRWGMDRRDKLPSNPPVPEAMGDREGDISVPLLAIADDAGGEWPARARAALLKVFGLRASKEGTMETGAMLLSDIRQLYLGKSALQLTSEEIVNHLGGLEERPWAEWRHGKPMTKPQLARALQPFGPRPATIRTGGDTAKGYHREAFEEAWDRYLAPETSSSAQEGVSEPSHRNNADKTGTSSQFRPVTPDDHVPEQSARKANENGHCYGVTDREPPFSGNKGADGAQTRWSGTL